MRTELRKRKIRKLKVVFSDEQPVKPDDDPALSCRKPLSIVSARHRA